MFFLKRLLFVTTSCLVFSMCFSVLYGFHAIDRVEYVATEYLDAGQYEELVSYLEGESDLSDEMRAYLSIAKYKIAEEKIIGNCDLDLIHLSTLKTACDDFPETLHEGEGDFKTEHDKMHNGWLNHRFNNNLDCYKKDKGNCENVVEDLNDNMGVSDWSDAGAKETLVNILRDCASDDSSGLTAEKRKEFTELANKLAPPEADELRRDCDILYNKLSDDDRKNLTEAQASLDCYIGKIEEINGQIENEDGDDEKAKLQNISYPLRSDVCQYLVATGDLEKINDGIAYCKAAYDFDNDKYANNLVLANYKKFEALGDSEYSEKYKILDEEVYPNIGLITDDDLKETISNNVEEFVKSYISYIKSLANWKQQLSLLQGLYTQLSILDPSSDIAVANLCKLNHMEKPDIEVLDKCLKNAESLGN